MIRMTLLSLLGHVLAAIAMVVVTWFEPTPKVKRPPAQKVRPIPGGTGQYGGGGPTPAAAVKTPVPMAAKATPPPVSLTPQATIAAKKTIAVPKKTATPKKTPEKTKKEKPKKTPLKTPTPAKTAAVTPAPPAKTAAAKTATPAAPSPTPAVGAGTPTPGAKATLPGLNIGGGNKTGTPGGVPGIPGGTGPPEVLSDYEYYLLSAKVQIDRNFVVPRHLRSPGVSCLAEFTILRDGKIVNIRVLKSAGDGVLDGYAVRALETTGRLAPFPDTLKESSFELQANFSFDPQDAPNP